MDVGEGTNCYLGVGVIPPLHLLPCGHQKGISSSADAVMRQSGNREVSWEAG